MLTTTQALVNIEGGANSQLSESRSYLRYKQGEDVFLQLPASFGRAVGAGPAGPAAAGPIFGQACAKMPYELRRVVQLFLSK